MVLFDTLIEQMNENEVIAVLGHEFGHWKLSHNIKNLVIRSARIPLPPKHIRCLSHQFPLFSSEIPLFILFYLFGKFIDNKDMYTSFGFTDQPIIIGLILFQFIYSPVEHVLGLFMVGNPVLHQSVFFIMFDLSLNNRTC